MGGGGWLGWGTGLVDWLLCSDVVAFLPRVGVSGGMSGA